MDNIEPNTLRALHGLEDVHPSMPIFVRGDDGTGIARAARGFSSRVMGRARHWRIQNGGEWWFAPSEIRQGNC